MKLPSFPGNDHAVVEFHAISRALDASVCHCTRAFVALVLLAIVLSGTALAQSPPQQFTATFTSGGASITVNFERHSIRHANFNVVVQDGSGNLTPYAAPESRTYLGT